MRPSASRLLNILVPVKRYPNNLFTPILLPITNFVSRCVDYAVKIRVNAAQNGVDLNVKHSMVHSPPSFLQLFTNKPLDRIPLMK